MHKNIQSSAIENRQSYQTDKTGVLEEIEVNRSF